MLPHLDTTANVVSLERELALKRAARRAGLIDAVKETRPAQTGVRIDTTIMRSGRLARAIQSLRWVFQPSHA